MKTEEEIKLKIAYLKGYAICYTNNVDSRGIITEAEQAEILEWVLKDGE